MQLLELRAAKMTLPNFTYFKLLTRNHEAEGHLSNICVLTGWTCWLSDCWLRQFLSWKQGHQKWAQALSCSGMHGKHLDNLLWTLQGHHYKPGFKTSLTLNNSFRVEQRHNILIKGSYSIDFLDSFFSDLACLPWRTVTQHWLFSIF